MAARKKTRTASSRTARTPARRKKNARNQRRGESLLKVAARKQDKHRERTHRAGAVLILIGLIVALVWGVMAGSQALGTLLYTGNEEFRIQRIVIENPAGRLDTRHIREYAKVEEGENLFAVDLERIRRDLESVPMIRSVTVRRQVPDTLVIELEERAPTARLRLPGHRYMLAVDAEGCVLGPSPRSTYLPSITGLHHQGLRPGSEIEDPTFHHALRSIEICNRSRISRYVKIRNIDISRPEILDVLLRGGERVLLPVEDKEVRLAKLANILRREKSRGRKVASVDLTVEQNIPITHR